MTDLAGIDVSEWGRHRRVVSHFRTTRSRYIDTLRLRGWTDADVDGAIEDAYLEAVGDPGGFAVSTVFYQRAFRKLRELMRRREVPAGMGAFGLPNVIPGLSGNGLTEPAGGCVYTDLHQREIARQVLCAVDDLPDGPRDAVRRWLAPLTEGGTGNRECQTGSGERDRKYKYQLERGFKLLRENLSTHSLRTDS